MPGQNTDTKRRFRIIILGAGFSCPAGLPLAGELFEEIRRRARAQYGRINTIESGLDYCIEHKSGSLCRGGLTNGGQYNVEWS